MNYESMTTEEILSLRAQLKGTVRQLASRQHLLSVEQKTELRQARAELRQVERIVSTRIVQIPF